MLELLNVIATSDEDTTGDFIREQTHVPIPKPPEIDYASLRNTEALKSKRVGVPKMYVGQQDSDPHAKQLFVSPGVVELWESTAKDLEALGAEVVYTDFPLVTNYENDSKSGEANNVDGRPANWNLLERGTLIAQAWDAFLVQNNDPNLKSLADIKDSVMLFPKPPGYLPDRFLEVRNWIDYAGLPRMVQEGSIHDIPGMEQALKALEAQRKRDLEDWMDTNKLDVVAFPAQGDVGLADLEFNLDSTTHSLLNGVKYSNGNRAIRHLGVPTVSVPMGVMREKGMPVNLTFAGKAYEDTKLLEYAYAFEQATKKRIPPPLTPALSTDIVASAPSSNNDKQSLISTLTAEITQPLDQENKLGIKIVGEIHPGDVEMKNQIFVDGKKVVSGATQTEKWHVTTSNALERPECLAWDLKPLPKKDAMVVVVVEREGVREARVLWVGVDGNGQDHE
jgi:Asp-tRNA(Asn)/Glu-tRNA(Gln) amidotransferase A subunit family amidase